MATSRKKVIVRKWNQEWTFGYLPPTRFFDGDELRLLDLDGKVTSVQVSEIKWICFVRDFTGGEADNPERLLRKTFSSRPRTPGLWLRVWFKDNDAIEGLAQNDLSLLDSQGLSLIPPDSRSNTQRIVLPREAIRELEILSVIRAGASRKQGAIAQENLFKD